MKKYILLLAFFVKIIYLFSQNNQSLSTLTPQLPSTASLMKYIDYPVNLYHGMAQIEIPLYEFKEGEVTFPISLSYHHAGFKPRELSSPVGLGWSLNAGPSLSRSINGQPDESTYMVCDRKDRYTSNMHIYYSRIVNGIFDEDPDKFYYKTLSKSGAFYLTRSITNSNSSVTPVLHPYEPIKINYELANNQLNIFRLTDDNGYQYTFGGSGYWGEVSSRRTSWYIKQIISPIRGDVVSFEYNRNSKSPSELRRTTKNVHDYTVIENGYLSGTSLSGYISCNNSLKYPFLTRLNEYESKTYNILSPSELGQSYGDGTLQSTGCYYSYMGDGANNTHIEMPLSAIDASTVRIDFYGDFEINRITVTDKTRNKVIRTFILTQSNYTSCEWKKLDRLEILDENGAIVERYQFNYNESRSLPNMSYGYKCTDSWGFYNGGYVSDAVPAMTLNMGEYNLAIGGSSKLYGAPETGILTSITYPTGRKTTFGYEQNIRRKEPGEDYIYNDVVYAGGLRIKKLEEYDPISNSTLIKEYKYGKNEDGFGSPKHRVSLPEDFKYSKRALTYSLDGTLAYINSTVDFYTPDPVTELFYDGGAPVAYEYVTEYRTKKDSNQNLGKTIYKFAHDSNLGWTRIPGTTLVFGTNSDWSYGQLLEKTDYKRLAISGDYYKAVMKEENEYLTYKSQYIDVGKVYPNLIIRNTPSMLNYEGLMREHNGYDYWAYGFYSGCKKIISKTITEFTKTDSVKIRTEYEYNQSGRHLLPVKQKTINSNKYSNQTLYKYPEDIAFTNGSDEESARQNLISKNSLTTLLEQKVDNNGQIWINKYRYTYTQNKPLLSSILSGKESSLKEQAVVSQYDIYGNPVSVTANALNTVYLWGHRGQYLIAEIKNATFSQISGILGQALIDRVTTALEPSSGDIGIINNLRQNTSLNALITTYTYKPLVGISTVTDETGIITYYDYDASGRLKDIYTKKKNTDGTATKQILQQYYYHYQSTN